MERILTVGHGTLGADEFVDLLRSAGVDAVADIRRYPGSRRHPHVAREAMERWLPAAGIGYEWIVELGGRRKPDPNSPNVGLRNDQFRAYADHMTSAEFARGLDRLDELASDHTVTVMCSESVWWRCHRRLVADHLVLVESTVVEHLFHDGRCVAHDPMPAAHPVEGGLRYERDAATEATLF